VYGLSIHLTKVVSKLQHTLFEFLISSPGLNVIAETMEWQYKCCINAC